MALILRAQHRNPVPSEHNVVERDMAEHNVEHEMKQQHEKRQQHEMRQLHEMRQKHETAA